MALEDYMIIAEPTDDLIEKAREINPNASKREMDMLLSTGEQVSISLCAMCIESMGFQAISLTGWQAGMLTNSVYSNARIKRIRTERIQKELADRAEAVGDRTVFTWTTGETDTAPAEIPVQQMETDAPAGETAFLTGLMTQPQVKDCLKGMAVSSLFRVLD